jgi:hypothetical protein
MIGRNLVGRQLSIKSQLRCILLARTGSRSMPWDAIIPTKQLFVLLLAAVV